MKTALFLTLYFLIITSSIIVLNDKDKELKHLRQVQSHQLERAYELGYTVADATRYADRESDSYDRNKVLIKWEAMEIVSDSLIPDFDVCENIRSFAYDVFEGGKNGKGN